MVQTRKQEESSGSGVKMPGRDLRASSRDLKERADDADKDDDNEWSSRNHSRPQRTRRPNTRFEDIVDPPHSRTRRVVYVDSSASEDDSQSDESIYRVSRRGRSRRISRFRHTRKPQQRLVNISGTSNGHSEVSMEEDNPNPEDDGVRRSTRQRKLTYDNLDSSWIYGTQTLRGYPSYRGQDGLPPPQDMCQTRSRDRARTREAPPEEQPAPAALQPGQKQTSPVLRDRRKVVKEETNSGDENEAEGGDEQEPEEAEDKAASSVDENKPDAEETQQKRRTRQMHSPPPINDGFTDMYSRVKRTRRPTMRFSYSPNKSRSKTFSGRGASVSHSSSSDDEMEEGDSDREQGAEKRDRDRSVRTRKYQLRVIKPTVDRFQVQEVPVRRSSRALTKELCNTVLRRLGRRPPKRYGSASSSSSDSESRFEHKKAKSLAKARSRCIPLNYLAKDAPQVTGHHTIRSKDGKTANLADVGPMALDTTIRFSHVGGLEDHIRCLQEMVVFPMLYKEIFEKFNITAPKGVLFHGPPGTGKTLIARALANECSQGEHKVKFFMRKGADCLSKWVGESERQLRLLFEQAHQMRPSIIFFDEIDGLAPVRSSKQDQIHASIVSTLLALMDGLDNRGEVIVIGATNRIDAIDPALRRPGRFDRELYFPLPASKERQEILRIHMKKWEEAPPPEVLDELAEKAGGYCGSDLRALCAESVVQALRRTYPQIYKSSRKLLLNSNQVQVSRDDFAKAQAGIVPAAHRVCPNVARKLKPLLQPLLDSTVKKVLKQLLEIFPHGLRKEVDPWLTVNRPRLLLTGCGSEFAQTSHVAPAILYHMEHVRVHTLDLATLYEVSARSPEEAVIQVFQEARRNPPAVIYTPCIGQWWDMVPTTVQSVFLLQLRNLDQNSPVLLLSTTDSTYSELPHQLCELFSRYRDEVFTMSCPDDLEREAFFKPLFLEKATAPPPPPKPTEEELEELPLAPPPEPAKLTEDELGKLYQDEEVTLRELRIFLREVCAKLARNRQFFMFTKPVDITEVPDYLEIIEQPMDLETMMTKIDQHHYECAKDFLDDVDLICRNALEYNPDRDPADKLIRHRACFLRDSAYALIKAEMDSDFEVKCKKISQSRKKRGGSPSRFAPAPDFIHTMNTAPLTQSNKAQQSSKTQSIRSSSNLVNGDLSSHSSLASTGAGVTPNPTLSSSKKRKKSNWCKGLITKRRKRLLPTNEESPSTEKTKSPEAANGTDKDGKTSGKDQSDSPPASSSQDKDSLDDSKMSVDEKPGSLTSSPPKNGLVNGDLEPKEVETITQRTSTGRKSESKENDGGNDEVKSPRSSGSHSNKSGLKNAFSDSEGASVSGAETSKRRTKSLDSRKNSAGSLFKDVASPGNCTRTSPVVNTVLVDRVALEKLLHETVKSTSTCPAEVILQVYNRLSKCVEGYLTVWDRHSLPQMLKQEIARFEAHWKEKPHHG